MGHPRRRTRSAARRPPRQDARGCTAPLDAVSGKNDAARDAWEAEIKASAGGADPLDTWRRYLQWTREAYPTGGHSLALLERCAFEFKDDARYVDDLKYLHVWIEYASLVDDAEPLFQWLYDRRICQRHALFWESWAAIFEQQKRFDKADQTFKRGIAMQAQPLWRLQRSQKSFDHRQVKLRRNARRHGRRRRRSRRQRLAGGATAAAARCPRGASSTR